MKIFNKLKKKIMAFRDIFKDSNDLNEKTIVGFSSFAIMALFAIADIISGALGKDLVINEFIYNSFLIITLGSFGIAEIGKIAAGYKKNKEKKKIKMKKSELKQIIREEILKEGMYDLESDLNVKYDLGPNQIDRFEGTANMRDLKTLHDMLRIVGHQWFEEGFEKGDIKE